MQRQADLMCWLLNNDELEAVTRKCRRALRITLDEQASEDIHHQFGELLAGLLSHQAMRDDRRAAAKLGELPSFHRL